MRRRAWLALLVAGALGAFPAAAEAHGLAQRSNLPIPDWLFGWAATIVLVASFRPPLRPARRSVAHTAPRAPVVAAAAGQPRPAARLAPGRVAVPGDRRRGP